MKVPTAIDIEVILSFLTAILASSGFWMYFMKRMESRDLTKSLLIGLAHDRIIYLCMKYIQRGSVSKDEYENLCEFLYTPYIKMGGNGSAKRLMNEVDKLPIVNEINFAHEKSGD